MIIHAAKPLFAWDCLEDSPSLQTIRDLLAALPDGKLLDSLRAARGKGRNDYPVSVLWGVVVLRVALRHLTTEAMLDELRRNDGLRRLIGIESETGVPKKWNLSRFEDTLGQEPHRTLLKEVFNVLIQRLGVAIVDLGRDTAGDATALSARRKPEETAKEEIDEGLPQASGGRKEYKDEADKVVKVYEWFGYKFHLLVDVKHEVIVAWQVTSAAGEGTGDSSILPALLEQTLQVLPEGRIRTLAYDKAADDARTHQLLDQRNIKPLIQIRSLLGEDQKEQMLPGHDGNSNVVYDEAGTIYCYDKVSATPVKHKMSFIGYEKGRGTLKYRCPARHEEWNCPSNKHCNGSSCYGKTVRVKCDLDLRRFPPIPRATREFERRYKGRTAVERVNARAKVYWGPTTAT